jgi:hypothetical protein
VLSALAGEAAWRQLIFSDAASSSSSSLLTNAPASTLAGAGDSRGVDAAGATAVTNLARWPDYLETDTHAHGPLSGAAAGGGGGGLGGVLPDDHFSSALCSSLLALRSGQRPRVLSRVAQCTRRLFPALLEEGLREGGGGLQRHLLRLQQLVEVQEAASSLPPPSCLSLSPTATATPASAPASAGTVAVGQVLDSWRARLAGGSALNDPVCCESLLSLRLALLVSLPAPPLLSGTSTSSASASAAACGGGGGCSPRHLFQFLQQVLDVAGGESGGSEGAGGRGDGHGHGHATLLVSPLLYQTRALLFAPSSMRGQEEGQGKGQEVIKAEFALFER